MDGVSNMGRTACVVGGGPCGIFAVAALLKSGVKRVHWIDPAAPGTCGRLGRYGSVPANTRNDRLIEAFQGLPALRFDHYQARRVSGTRLLDADPMGTEPLGGALDGKRDGTAFCLPAQAHDATADPKV